MNQHQLEEESLQLHLFVDFIDIITHLFVGFIQVADDAAGMEHSGMIFVSAVLPDGAEGKLGVFLGEIHADLARLGHFSPSGRGVNGLNGDVEVIGNHFLDVFNGNLAGGAAYIFVNHLLCEVDGDLLVVDGRLRENGNHGTFQLADIGGDAQSNVFCDLIGKFDAVVLQFLVQNGNTGFQVGCGQLGNQAPFETG